MFADFSNKKKFIVAAITIATFGFILSVTLLFDASKLFKKETPEFPIKGSNITILDIQHEWVDYTKEDKHYLYAPKAKITVKAESRKAQIRIFYRLLSEIKGNAEIIEIYRSSGETQTFTFQPDAGLATVADRLAYNQGQHVFFLLEVQEYIDGKYQIIAYHPFYPPNFEKNQYAKQ